MLLRRSFVFSSIVAATVPLAALAQNNPLQSAFEGLGDSGRRAAQKQLQAGGFYNGAIDGSYGRGTQSALTNAADFIYENSYQKVRFDLASLTDARRYLNALARGDLGKYLFGEGDEADF